MKNNLPIILVLITTQLFAQGSKQLSNEDIWYSTKFIGESVRGVRSMNDGTHFTLLERENGGVHINEYSYKNFEKSGEILSSTDINVAFSNYFFSADENKLLLTTDEKAIYRRSREAYYYMYDRTIKEVKELSDPNLGRQRLAEFSPDGTKVAFVRNNNIFIVDVATGNEIQVTKDGEYNKIINGATDWVYEEEFGFAKGFYWSPDSRKIAFYRFDEERVKQFQMAMYGTLYPEQHVFKYPKAGEENSIVSVHIYDVESTNTSACDIGEETDQYVPRIKWTKETNKLCIYRLNRLQNHLQLLYADASSNNEVINTEVFFEEKTETYIEESNYDNLIFLEDKKHFIFTSDRDGFMHIYRYKNNGELVNQITQGDWDLEKLYGINEKSDLVFYTARENNPMQKEVYSINVNGKNKKTLSEKPGFNNPTFSNNLSYFINYHSDANQPSTITLHNSTGKLIKVLEANEELRQTLSEYQLSEVEFFKFNTSEDIELNGWMIKPPDFNPSIEYPVLMYVYGGPGANTVVDSWGGSRALWHQMMAQKGFIVVSVDGRGTGFRGRDFKNVTYKQLGHYETIDQIEAAKYLGSLDYVDEDRIGIHGWSYGGYMAALCITKGGDVFNAAISVAPVTNWRYYDTVYTERYMQKPQENGKGYDDNSPINHVEKLNDPYLIIHGSADDNVHYQNTMEMIDALVKANKQFDQASYTNKNHGIYGGTTRLHLYTKMTNFLEENLKQTKSINILD